MDALKGKPPVVWFIGFIPFHIHQPQFTNMGGVPLQKWSDSPLHPGTPPANTQGLTRSSSREGRVPFFL